MRLAEMWSPKADAYGGLVYAHYKGLPSTENHRKGRSLVWRVDGCARLFCAVRKVALAGQLRIRVLHGHARTPWFDYLIVSVAEMREIVAGTGWRVAKLIEANNPIYVAVLEKVARSPCPR